MFHQFLYLWLRMGKLDDFMVTPSVTHTPRLGDSVVLNCNPPTSYPPADVWWSLLAPDGLVEPVTYNNRISMDLEGNLKAIAFKDIFFFI